MISIKKNVWYSSIVTVANYIFPFLTYPYVSRVLGVSCIGACNFVDGIINYFLLFSMMGMSIMGIREISSSKVDVDRLNKTFSSLFILNTISTTLVLIFYVASIFLIPKLNEYKELMYIGILKLIFNYLLIEWFYKGIEDFKYIAVRTIIVKFLYVVSVFVFVRDREDYTVYFFLLTMMVVLNAIINILHSRKYVRIRISGISLKPYIKSFLILGLYFMLTSMYTSFNVVYLGFIAGETEVGYYTTATKLYSILLALFTAFTSVLMPRMSSLLSENKLEEFKTLFNKSVYILTGMTIPLILFSEFFAPEIIRLISGSGYDGAIIPMRIIMPLMLIIGYEQILVIQTLMPLKKDKVVFINSGIGAVISIFANILLVPSLQSIGSAIVWFISELTILLLSQHYVSKYIGMNFKIDLIIKNLLYNIPFLILLFVFHQFNFINNYSKLLICGILLLLNIAIVQIFAIKNPVAVSLSRSIANNFRKVIN